MVVDVVGCIGIRVVFFVVCSSGHPPWQRSQAMLEELACLWEDGGAPPQDGPGVLPMYDGACALVKLRKNLVFRLA